MRFTPMGMIAGLWMLMGAYWLVSAMGRKRAEKREAPAARLVHVALMAFAFLLLYSADPRFGPLDARFLPEQRWLEALGVALTAAGVGFAIWARRHLGKNWSSEVTIREDHKLIRTGPYARVRHPIYTGMLAGLVGTVIAIGEWRAVAGLAIAMFGFFIKARREEGFLARQFGAAFEEHKKLTGFFLPRLS